jgi:signal transduction histidine kinase
VREVAGQGLAVTLAALSGSQVAILGPHGLVAASFDTTVARALVDAVPAAASEVEEISAPVGGFWVTKAPLGEVGSVLFARSAAEELAVLPRLRRGAATAGLLALVLFMLSGALLSSVLSRRVGSLAKAADRLAAGHFDVPLKRSRIGEMDRLSDAFDRMRNALASRLDELARANRELEDRQARLSALQAEMMQRDRLVASGRLVAELTHEIRNPVANVRNCLEVIHRRLDKDPEARRFVDLAIDELLRMHELSERMLDLNRPIDPGASRCDVGNVIDQVTALYRAGERSSRWSLRVSGQLSRSAAIGPDALKQVLLNLLENAREAMVEGGTIEVCLADEGELLAIEVVDEGSGIAVDDLPRVFDPFFTTKGALRGTGLGLFLAEGLVRPGPADRTRSSRGQGEVR